MLMFWVILDFSVFDFLSDEVSFSAFEMRSLFLLFDSKVESEMFRFELISSLFCAETKAKLTINIRVKNNFIISKVFPNLVKI